MLKKYHSDKYHPALLDSDKKKFIEEMLWSRDILGQEYEYDGVCQLIISTVSHF